jgi:hypothetical protein
MRRAFKVALAMIMSIGVSIGLAGPAAACSWDSHCYGAYHWKDAPASFIGGSVWINPSYMQLPSSGTNFLTHELWVGDRNLVHWVEAGWFSQRDTAFPGAPVATPFGFWADHRFDGDSINLHVIATGETLHNVGVAVYKSGANTYHVGFDGHVAYSTSNPTVPWDAEVGSEITTANTFSYAAYNRLYWSDGSVWHSNWSSANYGSTVVNAPQTFHWTTPGAAFFAGVPS